MGQTNRSDPRPVELGDSTIAALSGAGKFERVPANTADEPLGATGAAGDYISHLIIVPATAAAGAVSMKDGNGGAISLFAGGGTTPLPTLAPIIVPLGVYSVAGAWKITTGANVSVIAIGTFS